MSMLMKIAPRATTGTGTVETTRSTAPAATGISASLEIRPYPHFNSDTGRHWVGVSGLVPMDPHDAMSSIDDGARLELRLRSDDPSDGGLRKGPYFSDDEEGGPGMLWADTDGLHFCHWVVVADSVLRTGTGWHEGLDDQLYVNVRFIDGHGGVRVTDTDVVAGDC